MTSAVSRQKLASLLSGAKVAFLWKRPKLGKTRKNKMLWDRGSAEHFDSGNVYLGGVVRSAKYCQTMRKNYPVFCVASFLPMLIRLSAITPSPTHRFMPSSPL